MAKGFKDKDGKFRPIVKSQKQKLTEPQLRKEFGSFAGVEKMKAKELVSMKKRQDKFDQADKDMKEYFESFNYDFIKNDIKTEEKIRLGDFDPDAMVDQDEADKLIQVEFIGELNDILREVVGRFKDGEIDGEIAQDYFFGTKGQDIIDKKAPELTLYFRDTDVFFVKGL